MFAPMPLLRVPQPFDHSAFIYELKFDGFRALVHISRDGSRLTGGICRTLTS